MLPFVKPQAIGGFRHVSSSTILGMLMSNEVSNKFYIPALDDGMFLAQVRPIIYYIFTTDNINLGEL